MATYALQVDGRIVKVCARSKQAARDKAVQEWQDRRVGIMARRRNRETGTTILLVDRQRSGAPDDGHRWETICDEHGTVCSHTTRALAEDWMAQPTGWCEDCQAAYSTAGKGSWDDFS